MKSIAYITPLILAMATTLAGAAPYVVDYDRSIFAIVTHKAGIGSGLAHDHFIFAPSPKVVIEHDAGALSKSRFTLEFPATSLVVDDTATTKKWFPRVKELGILDNEPSPVKASDVESITEDMLAEGQLHAAKHETISATVTKLTPGSSVAGFDHTVEVAITIKGKTVSKLFPAKVVTTGNELAVSSFGELKFTEFGIEPVSLFFGAIRNDDAFHMLVEFVATKV